MRLTMLGWGSFAFGIQRRQTQTSGNVRLCKRVLALPSLLSLPRLVLNVRSCEHVSQVCLERIYIAHTLART